MQTSSSMRTTASLWVASHCVQIIRRRLPGRTRPAVVADPPMPIVRNVLMSLAVGGLSERLCTIRERAFLAPTCSVSTFDVYIQPALSGVRVCTAFERTVESSVRSWVGDGGYYCCRRNGNRSTTSVKGLINLVSEIEWKVNPATYYPQYIQGLPDKGGNRKG